MFVCHPTTYSIDSAKYIRNKRNPSRALLYGRDENIFEVNLDQPERQLRTTIDIRSTQYAGFGRGTQQPATTKREREVSLTGTTINAREKDRKRVVTSRVDPISHRVSLSPTLTARQRDR